MYKLCLLIIALLIGLDFIVPFTLLSGVGFWYGSFLFWSLSTLVVIVLSVIASSFWVDTEHE